MRGFDLNEFSFQESFEGENPTHHMNAGRHTHQSRRQKRRKHYDQYEQHVHCEQHEEYGQHEQSSQHKHHNCHEQFNPHGHHDHHEHHEHHDHKKNDEDCICETIKKIHKAQVEADHCDCRVSCEKSIQQLLSGSKHKQTANTIPFSMDCGCETFFGKAPVYNEHGHFCIIASPFFKVKQVKENCCVVLELLWPTCDDEPFQDTFKENGHFEFPCCFDFNGFIGTGACITVDLKCFCSISCHKPTMVEHATEEQLHDIFKNHRHCHKK